MNRSTVDARSPRSRPPWSRCFALCSLALLAPLGLGAQQPATPAPSQTSDNRQLCAAMMGYVTQHPEVLQQMMQVTLQTPGTPPAKTDTVSKAARQSIAAAMMRRDFDSAAALTKQALPGGSDPQAAEAITKVFHSMAAVSDSAQLGRLADQLVLSAGADLNVDSFKFVGVLPDTLRTMLLTAAAASSNANFECSMNAMPQRAPSASPAPSSPNP